MSLASITNAQRYNVGNAVNIAAHNTKRFINNTKAPTAAQEALIADSMQDAADALAVAGYFALPAGTATVTDGAATAVLNSAGADPHNSTVVVNNQGVLQGVNLAATAAIVDNGDALTVPVTGTYTTTATISVANGVVTGIVLS